MFLHGGGGAVLPLTLRGGPEDLDARPYDPLLRQVSPYPHPLNVKPWDVVVVRVVRRPPLRIGATLGS